MINNSSENKILLYKNESEKIISIFIENCINI